LSAAHLAFPIIGLCIYGSPLAVAGYGVTKKISAISILSGTSSSVSSKTVTIGNTLSLSGKVLTVVTTGAQADGTSLAFKSLRGITTDGSSFYIADTGNNLIRKMAISFSAKTLSITTLAGSTTPGSYNATGTSASFNSPDDVTSDGTYLYVADTNNNEIRKIDIATGEASTLAGSSNAGVQDGTGAAASFNSPRGITTDGTNLYVTDYNNNEIRQITIATGTVKTLAGTGTAGAGDGTGTGASFDHPVGITTDGTNLYVADIHDNCLRKVVISTGAVTTLANNTLGPLYYLLTDGTNLYVTDFGNAGEFVGIKKYELGTGIITTLAGSTTSGTSDGTGEAAQFGGPAGITTDGSYLYICDMGNSAIRLLQ
jgi:hypothetical protein